MIGYLHTGIEKNCEYRTWTQGVTFVTRMDYLAPLFNEAAYCLGVEKLLGIEVPRRAQVARVLLMELNRIGSHLVCLATGGMELGALTGMTAGFREREEVLHLLEFLTGLRMNHAFIRPGGLAQDLPEGWAEKVTDFIKVMRSRLPGLRQAAHRPADLAPAPGGRRLPAARRLPRARRHRPDPAQRRAAVGPAQGRAVLRLRGVRLRGAHRHGGRLLRPLPAAGRGDARVAQDRRAGRGEDGAGPGDGRGPQDRLARAAVGGRRRHGQLPRARPQDHGPVDGVADPPLQAGHRGLRGAGGPGVRARSSRRAASSATTWSPTAAPGRCACTSASPAS